MYDSAAVQLVLVKGRARRWTIIGIAAVLVLYAWDVWQRRWISDDGLIVVRTVRQILAGNGPNVNAFERAEADTSVLWTWLVAAAAWITRANVAHVAVLLGGVLSIAGLGIAMDATRRLLVARGSDCVLVPAGALVVLGVYPFWDYATSGLETGLCFAWVATIWWLLVTLRPGRELAYSIVVGLGPLVRPDLAITSAVFLGTGWWIVRPTRRRTLILAAAATALPIAYEIFRAGYYGTLVPLPALAKSAGGSAWSRGFGYLLDFVRPYMLWIPATVIAVLATTLLVRRTVRRAELVVPLAPVLAALLSTLFVLRVGGDFMHGRMLLVPTLLAVMPVVLLPLRNATQLAIGALAAWALTIGIRLNDHKSHANVPPAEDERAGYVSWTRHLHPIDGRVFVSAAREWTIAPLAALAHHDHLLFAMDGASARLAPSVHAPLVIAAGRLGTTGELVPLDAITADTLGLANPLGARMTATLPGFTGHEKPLPAAWLYGDFADPALDSFSGTTPEAVRAARHALSCGEIAELLASVREPMSFGRFWDNLVGSVRRTRLVIPADPIEAEKRFCR